MEEKEIVINSMYIVHNCKAIFLFSSWFKLPHPFPFQNPSLLHFPIFLFLFWCDSHGGMNQWHEPPRIPQPPLRTPSSLTLSWTWRRRSFCALRRSPAAGRGGAWGRLPATRRRSARRCAAACPSPSWTWSYSPPTSSPRASSRRQCTNASDAFCRKKRRKPRRSWITGPSPQTMLGLGPNWKIILRRRSRRRSWRRRGWKRRCGPSSTGPGSGEALLSATNNNKLVNHDLCTRVTFPFDENSTKNAFGVWRGCMRIHFPGL